MSSCNRCGKTLHGSWLDFLCPECKSIEREMEEGRAREEEREERAASALERSREQSREDRAAAAAYMADAKNNPGDYDCPSCLFRTLKKGASRCPICHADPGRQYWLDVETKERDARLRAAAAAAEWERGRPVRELEARAEVAIKRRVDRWSSFWIFYFAYLLPSLVLTSFSVIRELPALGWEAWPIFTPVLNWLGLLQVMFVGQAMFIGNDTKRLMEIFYGSLIFWVILGSILWLVTKPNTKIEAVSTAEAEVWEQGKKGREQKARNKAFVSDVLSKAFEYGFGGAVLGAFVGFGKGCVRFDGSRPNPYGHSNFLEPFW